MMASYENGLQLLVRLTTRPALENLDPRLFSDGLEMGDTILVSGAPSTGKSLLLYQLIANCILPKSFGGLAIPGLEAHVILIETDHNKSILQLITMLERILSSPSLTAGLSTAVCKNLTRDEKKSIIEESLRRLILLKTYSSDQMLLNFVAIEKLMAINPKISLVAVDTISAFYWEDVVKLNGLRKKDLYLKNMMQKLDSAVREFKVVTIIVRPANFQSLTHNPNVGNCRYFLEMRKSDIEETGECIVRSGLNLNTLRYSLGKEGFKCNVCGSVEKYEELIGKIKRSEPTAVINGTIGRQGSFEVKINEKPVYSKLATLAYPDFDAVAEMVVRVEAGEEPNEIKSQQPITDCILM